jgi:hypothetical protein
MDRGVRGACDPFFVDVNRALIEGSHSVNMTGLVITASVTEIL